MKLLQTALLAIAFLSAGGMPAEAVILYRTGDITANTTTPGGDRDTPWSLEGTWGNFLGTPISSKHFITAKHVGGSVGGTFTLGGDAYTTVQSFTDLSSDLRIWEISGSFSSWIDIYDKSDEVGKELFVVGRGTQRGAEVNVTGASVSDLRGWGWGSSDHVKRWGENEVSSIESVGGAGQQLYATFDRVGGMTEEAHLSVGDSGGAAFIKDTDDGKWKLAGIHYAVDGSFNYQDNNATEFEGAIFDAGGVYCGNDTDGYELITDEEEDVRSGFYSTRISARKNWILSIIPEPSTSSLFLLGASFLALSSRLRSRSKV
jgi:hypothetical protein